MWFSMTQLKWSSLACSNPDFTYHLSRFQMQSSLNHAKFLSVVHYVAIKSYDLIYQINWLIKTIDCYQQRHLTIYGKSADLFQSIIWYFKYLEYVNLIPRVHNAPRSDTNILYLDGDQDWQHNINKDMFTTNSHCNHLKLIKNKNNKFEASNTNKTTPRLNHQTYHTSRQLSLDCHIPL